MTSDSKNLSKPAEEANNDMDLLAFMFSILRGWKTILFLALLGFIIGVLYSRSETTIYQSSSVIQIESSSKGVSALGAGISDLIPSEGSAAQTEAQLIQSRMVIKPVIDLLHLSVSLNDPNVDTIDKIRTNSVYTQNNTPKGVTLETDSGQVEVSQFNVSQDYLDKSFILVRSDNGFTLSNGFDSFQGQFNESMRFRGENGVIEINVNDLPASDYPINITKRSLQNTTNAIVGALTVAEVGTTGILKLSMTGPDQDQITRILREIVFSYVKQNNSRGSEETTKTLEFMETQIPNLRQKLEQSEAAFNQFRTENGTIDVNQEASILVGENASIDSQLSELRLKKAELTTYYTEEHPLVIQIDDQIAELQNRIQDIDSRVEELPEIQREFLKLSEDVGINREIYLSMLKNYQQLQIAKAGQVGFARIIDLPISTYRAIAPKKSLIVILATLTGLLFGIMLVMLKNLLRHVVKDPERLESKTGVPVIATIPSSLLLTRLNKGSKSSNRLLAHVDNNSLSYEGIKSLRTSLIFGMPSDSSTDQSAKVILITGESPGVGKSFISSNLSEVLAQLDKKVLIIDADMRLGELHKVFNMSQDDGLADYFQQGSHTLKDIVHPTSLDNVDFIPRGKQPKNPTSLLSSDKFSTLMTELNTCYDYIVIDSPPILAASDAMIISHYADKVLIVTRYDYSIEGQLVYAIKQFNKANIRVDGLVLNDVKQGLLSKYSYNYSYAYGDNK